MLPIEKLTIEKLTKEELIAQIDKIEEKLAKDNTTYFCPNHDLEIYLFEFYCNKKDYQVLEDSLSRMYFELAKKYRDEDDAEEMFGALESAKKYNPVDIEILDMFAREYYKVQALDEMFTILKEMFPYIYTRRDISEYYCLLGCYYLDKLKPEIAEGLYMYSSIFYVNNQANQDLEYISKAVGRKKESLSPVELQKYLQDNGFETQPKKETLALLYKVSEIEIKEGNLEYAQRLLLALYELTNDKEVYYMIKLIDENVGK